MIRLEVCVDTVAGLEAAVAGGADRIELCAALSEGGLTPSVGFMKLAAGCGLPVRAMIRPRGGDFLFGGGELAVMAADIDAARGVGLEGVVLGAALADGRVDPVALGVLMARAEGMGRTLHRVIDGTPDKLAAVAQARELGFDCVLSSGGKDVSFQGVDLLARMVAQGGITVMPGAGISAGNARAIAAATGAEWLHGSFREGVASVRRALG